MQPINVSILENNKTDVSMYFTSYHCVILANHYSNKIKGKCRSITTSFRMSLPESIESVESFVFPKNYQHITKK